MRNFKKMLTVWILVFMSLIVAAGPYAAEGTKIDINRASAEELTRLTGVGPSHAAAIVAFREKNGPFKEPEDLMQVPRIGRKTFEKNKDLIVVGNAPKKMSKKSK
jgi:competence protein ComEA